MEFKFLKDPLRFAKILWDRLPASTNVYNVMKQHEKWRKEHQWLTLGAEDCKEEDLWLVVLFFREDCDQVICVSRPPSAEVTPEIHKAFAECQYMDWDESYMFCAVDPVVMDMVIAISVKENGNEIKIIPCILHASDPEKSKNIELKYDRDIEVKALDEDKGKEFLLRTWRFTAKGTDSYVARALRSNHSAGVYKNGEVVAGTLFDAHGQIGMLYSLPEYRGKGYASLVTQHVMKSSAQDGFLPCATVGARNSAAQAFERKMGCLPTVRAAYVIHVKVSAF